MDTFFIASGVIAIASNLGFMLYQVLTGTVVGRSIMWCCLSIVLALVLILPRV